MTSTERIDGLIAGLADWRGKTLALVRQTILAAEPDIVEDRKWTGSPVWSKAGIIAVGNAHKDKVKLTFAQGASLGDPYNLFENGFGGMVWRAIDLGKGDTINADALQPLVRAAVAYNQAQPKKTAGVKTTRSSQGG